MVGHVEYELLVSEAKLSIMITMPVIVATLCTLKFDMKLLVWT